MQAEIKLKGPKCEKEAWRNPQVGAMPGEVCKRRGRDRSSESQRGSNIHEKEIPLFSGL